ncbi:beta-lactamase/transpeptidase-like protein [Testicularia cyperi]|uniref:Beta-lactamase/transpeptidase-like protein n=1 Tax=Testicularia cyperi TaxID=1882483 RepID=A0A317XWX4_9BASI|nr:beta-lactamase/transpeptidase-like protein [Testicularia cyperi]
MSLQETAQKVLDQATADPTSPNAVPGAVVYVSDKSGKPVVWASAGVRQLGKSDPMTKDSIFWIASCTKLVTAIACLQLVEQGKLDLQDNVTKYCPEFANTKMYDGSEPEQHPTVWNCLTHTCGLGYPFFNKHVDEYFTKHNQRSFSCQRVTIESPYVTQPGTEWEYGGGIDWAGQVVEKISGLSLNDYCQQNIFKPLGITSMSFLPQSAGLMDRMAGSHHRDADGVLSPNQHWMEQDDSKIQVHYGGAGLYANASEYVQILVALLNDGTHPKGGQILKPESVKELRREQLTGKHVDDMDREFPNVRPDEANWFEGCTVKGIKKNWALGGIRVLVEHPMFKRSDDSLFWCGIQNSFWWCDFKDGTCGMVQGQIGPFLDMGILGILAQVEPQVHAAYAEK